METKIKVSQDFLFDYLKEHSFIITVLSTYMGISESIVRGCFGHKPNRLGRPMSFSAANIARLNETLPQIADELRHCILTFGSPQTFTNQRGTAYDPDLVEQIRNGMGKFFKMKGMTENVLGWNKVKCDTTLAVRKSPMYGKVSREDADRLNAELLSVAAVLSSYEVIETINPDKQDSKPIKTKEVHTQAQERHPWDDTARPLMERYEIFHSAHPESILFFRIDGDYSVIQDDARLLLELDSSLQGFAYTNLADGLLSVSVYADKFAILMPHCVGINLFVGITDLFASEK